MSDEPDLVEDEEEEEKKTGRSAYFAGVHAAEEGFSGSYRGVKPAPHGGAASVKDQDTIGSIDCWCGQPLDHDWPGKDRGAKHPRKETQVSTVRHVEEDAPYLNSRDIKIFDQRVIRMLTALVNDYGIKFRLLDGSHILIYGLDGETSLKVSAARKAEQSMAYIEKFTRTAVTPFLVENQVQALAAQFNDPSKRPHNKKAAPVKAATPKPTPTPKPQAVAPDPELLREIAAADEWTPYVSDRRDAPEETNWEVSADGQSYRCTICGYISHGRAGLGGHNRAHSDRAKTSAERMGRSAHIQSLLSKLARACEVDLVVNSDAQTRKVAKLEEQLAKVTAERDDLKARVELMREAMRA